MKKVLFFSLLAAMGAGISAQNLINNGKFETEVTAKVTNRTKRTRVNGL